MSRRNLLSLAGGIVVLAIALVTLQYHSARTNRYDSFRVRYRIVWGIDLPDMMNWLAKEPDTLFRSMHRLITSKSKDEPDTLIMRIAQQEFRRRGVPMSRYFGNEGTSDSTLATELLEIAHNSMKSNIDVVRNRLDQYGATNISVKPDVDGQFVAEFQIPSPGESVKREIRELVRGRGKIGFIPIVPPRLTYSILASIDSLLHHFSIHASIDSPMDPYERIEIQKELESFNAMSGIISEPLTISPNQSFHDGGGTSSESMAGSAAPDSIPYEQSDTDILSGEFDRRRPFFSLIFLSPHLFTGEILVPREYKAEVIRLLELPSVNRLIPKGVAFLWGPKPAYVRDGHTLIALYPVLNSGAMPYIASITGSGITKESGSDKPVVTMSLTAAGTRDWSLFTRSHLGKRIAITSDSAVFNVATVGGRIDSGRVVFENLPDLEDARLLQIILTSQSLAAPLKVKSLESIVDN